MRKMTTRKMTTRKMTTRKMTTRKTRKTTVVKKKYPIHRPKLKNRSEWAFSTTAES